MTSHITSLMLGFSGIVLVSTALILLSFNKKENNDREVLRKAYEFGYFRGMINECHQREAWLMNRPYDFQKNRMQDSILFENKINELIQNDR